jgi:hypothetical protein
MDERNDLDQALLILNPVIDQVVAMDQFAEAGSFFELDQEARFQAFVLRRGYRG